MEKLNARNMNSYMFNKIRTIAVACGIAIVSGNICGICDKSDTPPLNSGGGAQQGDPRTYVLKSDLGGIKNANGDLLFTGDYTKVNEAYINGLSADELKNNVVVNNLGTEKDKVINNAINNAINDASAEALKNAPNFGAAVSSLTDEVLRNNATYNQLKANAKKKKDDINVGDTIAIKIVYSCEGETVYTEEAIVKVVGDEEADGNGKIKISTLKSSKMPNVKCDAKEGAFGTTFTNVSVKRIECANKILTRAVEVILWS